MVNKLKKYHKVSVGRCHRDNSSVSLRISPIVYNATDYTLVDYIAYITSPTRLTLSPVWWSLLQGVYAGGLLQLHAPEAHLQRAEEGAVWTPQETVTTSDPAASGYVFMY